MIKTPGKGGQERRGIEHESRDRRSFGRNPGKRETNTAGRRLERQGTNAMKMV
jgi:hypothetical protein